jgi:hypothetical protein
MKNIILTLAFFLLSTPSALAEIMISNQDDRNYPATIAMYFSSPIQLNIDANSEESYPCKTQCVLHLLGLYSQAITVKENAVVIIRGGIVTVK